MVLNHQKLTASRGSAPGPRWEAHSAPQTLNYFRDDKFAPPNTSTKTIYDSPLTLFYDI